MTVSVIPDSVIYSDTTREGKVSLFAETREELDNNDVLNLARSALISKGMDRPGLNKKGTPYPVNDASEFDAGITSGDVARSGFRMDLRYLSQL